MAEIYRKSSLEKLSSPEQLDRMIRITSPMFWLAMIGAGSIILIALLWAIVGRLPVTVNGNGVYINSDGVATVYSDTVGVVSSISVEAGDTVESGQVVVTVTDKDTQASIDTLTQRISEVESVTLSSTEDVVTADTKDLVELKRSLEATGSTLQQNIASLTIWQNQYATEQAKLSSLETRLNDAKNAYYSAMDNDAGGSTLELAYTQASNTYQAAQEALANAQTNLNTYQMAYDAIKQNVDNLQKVLDTAEQNLAADPTNPQLQQAVTDAESDLNKFLSTDSSVGGTNNDVITKYLPAAQQDVANAQSALDAAKKDLDAKDAAYKDYVKDKASADVTLQKKQQDYNDLSTQYATQQGVVTSLQQNIASVQAQIAAEGSSSNTQADTLTSQFTATRDALLSSLQEQLKQANQTMSKTNITAAQAGTVLEVPISVGTVIGQGSELLKLSSESSAQSNVVVCYVPLSSGKKVSAGMTVMVYPTTVNKQEYGHMEATVLSVDEYVTSAAQIKNTLGDELLASSFTQNGPVIAITCELKPDNTTASGYYWSSQKASDILLAEGTLVTVDVVTERKAPIQMVIPMLKEMMSMSKKETEG